MASLKLSNMPVDLAVRDPQTASAVTFIFGAARSGTTWLAKLFDSSPDVLYCHEPFTKGSGLAYHRAVNAVAAGQGESIPDRGEIVRELIATRRTFARPPFFWKQFQPRSFSLMRLSWYLGRITGLNFLRGGQIRGPVHLVIKEGLTVSSLPLAQQLGAHAVVLFRHPCAVVNSRLRGERCGAMERIDRPSLVRACESICPELGFSPRQIMGMKEDEALALDWLVTYLPVAQLTQNRPAGVQWVTYEHLVERPGEVLGELFTSCGLQLKRQTLRFVAHSSQTHPGGLRMLLGRRARYFGVERRVEEPAHQWQAELPPDSIRRILGIAELFPLGEFWPQTCTPAATEQPVASTESPPQLLAGA